MFYAYYQNNSGGSFDYNAESGVSEYVIIEAGSEKEADEKAQAVGIYFDEDYDVDCECCGTRWSGAWGGTEAPEIYGKHPIDYSPTYNWMGENTNWFIHYLDGRIEYDETKKR